MDLHLRPDAGRAPFSVVARATDDSLNTGPTASVAVSTACPCSLFGVTAPTRVDAGDGSDVELGVRFTPSVSGWVTGVRFYKSLATRGCTRVPCGPSPGLDWPSGTFTNETATGWQTLQFAGPVAVTAGTSYIASYFAPNGHYAADSNFYAGADHVAAPLTAPRSSDTSPNGVYNLGAGFPARSYQATNYGVDVLFDDRDTYGPAVLSQTPLPDSSSISTSTRPQAVFGEAVAPSSISFSLKDTAGAAVSGTTSYDAETRTATFTPESLARGVTYTATVSAKDTVGNAMEQPVSWSFRTALPSPEPGVCPCGLWDDATQPAVASVNDAGTIELGVRFSAESDGQVTGVRFFKGPKNTGTHTGSLWSVTGQLLATVTFGAESSTGWQSASFSQPVTVAAGQTYVVSYRTTTGYYSANTNMFDGVGVDNPPLHAPATAGVYKYGGGVPERDLEDANYWVDPVFTVPATVVPRSSRPCLATGSTSVPVDPARDGDLPGPGPDRIDAVRRSRAPNGAVAGTTAWTRPAGRDIHSASVLSQRASRTRPRSQGRERLGGAPMAEPYSFGFTTAGGRRVRAPSSTAPRCPPPSTQRDTAPSAWASSSARPWPGYVTGMRFYKGLDQHGHPHRLPVDVERHPPCAGDLHQRERARDGRP